MRHEGRGGVSAATLILAITIISFVLKAMFTGTVFKSSASENEIVFAVLTVRMLFAGTYGGGKYSVYCRKQFPHIRGGGYFKPCNFGNVRMVIFAYIHKLYDCTPIFAFA